MYYADITVTSQFSLVFLDSLFTGNFINFYSEEKSIDILYEKILHMFHIELSNDEFELIFVDDYSKDNTRNIYTSVV